MLLISMMIPGGERRTAKLILSQTVGPDGKEVVNAVSYGHFAGGIVDFVAIALCIYVLTKAIIKEEAPAPAPPTKT